MQKRATNRIRQAFIVLMAIALHNLWQPLVAQPYQTAILSSRVKSLQVKGGDDIFYQPSIALLQEEALEVSFDIINQSEGRYAYSIYHCDANWEQSSITPIEYMEGFQSRIIGDYSQSINTTTQYTNYRLLLPNEDIRFKISGNYALVVYPEEAPEQILFTARFAVYESLVDIDATISGNTDISYSKGDQQISFSVDQKNIVINDPQRELKVYVYQNNRTDNVVTEISPSLIKGNQLIYHHLRPLIFDAGNEYRRFEFLTHRYNGMRIEKIEYLNPYYHVDLMIDESRAGRVYQYDQDQNGRYFVRCSQCQEPDVEADYYIVHFAYRSEWLFDGDLYLLGDLLQNRLDEKSKMRYNQETRQYELALLLKQGHYNYQYLFVPHDKQQGELKETGGDYYQTENEYTIYVYYRRLGDRYDRLIGIETISNRQPLL